MLPPRSWWSTTTRRRGIRPRASSAPAGFTVARGRHRPGGAAPRRRAARPGRARRQPARHRRLRGLPPPARRAATARTPVIHLSATFVNDVDKVQGLDAGADGYLTHPVEPPVLVATVNAFLRARRAEDALRESEAKFKAVFEQALNGIALLSHDMIFLEVNPAMCATFGRDRANVIGKHISAFNAGGTEHRVEEITAALAATGAVARHAAGAARGRPARRARLERVDPFRPRHPPRHHHRRHRTARDRGRARTAPRQRDGGAGRGRARQPGEGRLPGGAVARAAHAAQRDRRLVAAAQAARRGR